MQLTKENIKIGLRVSFYFSTNGISYPATIVSIDKYASSFNVQWDEAQQDGNTKKWGTTLHYHSNWSILDQSVCVKNEKPCGVCSRMNDVGVSTCWCCGNKP